MNQPNDASGSIRPRQAPADVDVIILSWNRVEETIAAIASAAEQEGVSKKVMVVDQGSEPASLARLEQGIASLPDVVLLKLGRNSGVAGGRNIASALGSSPCIVALDSDAVFAGRQVLAKVVRQLETHPELCALGFRISNYFTGQNDETSWDYSAERRPDQTFASTRFIGAGHAIRRQVFEGVGGYDDRLFFCGEEVDLCYRMLNTGQRIQYFADAQILHKVSPEHRVYWGKGRFFYTVRNNLYSMYKFNAPLPRLGLAATAFLVKACANGIPSAAVRGIREAVRMCSAYRREVPDKSAYRLSEDTWRYINEMEPWRKQGLVRKAMRQLRLLPHQS